MDSNTSLVVATTCTVLVPMVDGRPKNLMLGGKCSGNTFSQVMPSGHGLTLKSTLDCVSPSVPLRLTLDASF